MIKIKQKGAGMIEYALLVSLIAVVVIAGVTVTGVNIRNIFNNTAVNANNMDIYGIASMDAGGGDVDVTYDVGALGLPAEFELARTIDVEIWAVCENGGGGKGEAHNAVTLSPGDQNTITVSVIPAPLASYDYECTINGIVEGTSPGGNSSGTNTFIPSATAISGTANLDEITYNWTAPSNGGSAILGYVIETDTDPGFASPTSISAAPGDTSATYTGSFGITQYFRIKAVNAVGEGPWSNTYSVTPVAVIADAPVGSKTLVMSSSADYYHYNWTAPADNGATISGYEWQISSDSGFATGPMTQAITQVPTIYQMSGIPIPTEKIDNTDILYVRVRAVNAGGTSAWSATVSMESTLGAPDAPGSFVVTNGTGTDVDLDWDAATVNSDNPNVTNDGDITGYTIEISTDIGFTSPTTETTGAAVTEATITGLTIGEDYYFRVRAENNATENGGIGEWSAVSSSVTIPAVAPEAPAGSKTLVAAASGDYYRYDWTVPASNGSAITGYEWQTSLDSGFAVGPLTDAITLVSISSQVSGVPTGTNLLENADTLYVRVRAVNAVGASAWSSTVSMESTLGAPDAPGSFVATNGTGTDVDLDWDAATVDLGNPNVTNDGDITGYTIEISTNIGFTSPTTETTGAAVTEATITGLTIGETYYFRVRAESSATENGGIGEWSAVSSSVTIPTVVPAAPTNLTVTRTGSGTASRTWTIPASNGSAITGWIVQRANNSSFTSGVVTSGSFGNSGTSSSNAGGLANGTTYYYRILAINSYGQGPWSNIDSVVTYTTPSQITNKSASAPNGWKVKLTWTPASNGGASIDYYQVQTTTGLTYTTSSLSYTWSSLSQNTTYYLRVRAHNAAGYGSWSGTDSAVTWSSTLAAEAKMGENHHLTSTNGLYELSLFTNGALAITNTSTNAFTWGFGSNHANTTRLWFAEHVGRIIMQRNSGGWGNYQQSSTPGSACYTGTLTLTLQNDGNLVIANTSIGKVVWSSSYGATHCAW